MDAKTKLIKLAKEVGFASQISLNPESIFKVKEDLRYYLWMCELQKWCREKYNININLKHRTHSQTYCFNITSDYENKNSGELYSDLYSKKLLTNKP